MLVVDDDRTIRLMVRRLLEKDGFEVIEGENGRDAVDLAARERPNLLLIDLMMPEMDGFQAIGALRSDARFRALPVIVLTAESEAGVEERVLELGADDYVLKPFDPGVLVSRVRAVFRRLGRLLLNGARGMVPLLRPARRRDRADDDVLEHQADLQIARLAAALAGIRQTVG